VDGSTKPRPRFFGAWAWILGAILVPAIVYATGTLTVPNNIFTQAGGTNVAPLLDANYTAIKNYVNTREVTVGLLASRPAAGTQGRWYLATDQGGGTTYVDSGTAWVQTGAGVSTTLANQRASMTLSNNGTATSTFLVFPGAVSSDDLLVNDKVLISNTSTKTKTLAAWAVGNNTGCLDTGTVAAFTFYHVYVITRVDTGVVDILCSVSGPASTTQPTMPTNYTKKQRLGAIRTTWFGTPGAEIYPFTQIGRTFRWATVSTTLDVNNATPGTNAVAATLSVPNGVFVEALLNCVTANTGQIYATPLFASDEAPAGPISCSAFTASQGNDVVIIPNATATFRYRNAANVSTQFRTLGWKELWD
jgi:hypothetical protein